MEHTITLDEKDIAQIIANSYDCDLKNVQVFTEISYEGYGPSEHPVSRVRAKITITQEGKHTRA